MNDAIGKKLFKAFSKVADEHRDVDAVVYIVFSNVGERGTGDAQVGMVRAAEITTERDEILTSAIELIARSIGTKPDVLERTPRGDLN